MSNLYEITKSIHNEIERINQKLGLEIEIKNTIFYISPYGVRSRSVNQNTGDFDVLIEPYYLLIEIPQIRQILVALQEVLGSEYTEEERVEMLVRSQGSFFSRNLAEAIVYNSPKVNDKAKRLDDKWFRPVDENGKYTGQSLFDQEPELVLTELLEILKTL